MQYNFKDLKGIVFGRLTVIELDLNNKFNGTYWMCLCECGKTKSVRSDHLTTGKITSCRCFMREHISIRNTTHGQNKEGKRTSEYTAWRAMRQRISSKSYHARSRYSERGIEICDRWKGKEGFKNFFEDMGSKPTQNHSLDRFPNPDGNYEPSNCRWATIDEQQKNKSSNRWIEHYGEKLTLSDWARKLKINPSTLSEHLQKKTIAEIVLMYHKKRNN